MKILVVHNFYQQPGGEDRVFDDECALLEAHGHDVIRFTRHNDNLSGLNSLQLLRNTVWNRAIADELSTLIQRERPAVMHCHNTFPMVSPAAYYAAKLQGVAVVQTLHNYRLLCPAATLLRNGKVCEKCVGSTLKLPAIQHACYRGSRSATAATTAMLAFHEHKQTWTESVDRYIALTEFSRNKFIEGGLPASKICVKPNVVQPDPGPGRQSGGYAVFVGRLSAEKGIQTLLDAWTQIPDPIPLRLAGDGPLAELVQSAASADSRIQWLGQITPSEVATLVGDARLLVMPSVWYETFGRTVIEAFAAGTPVVASRMGAMQELIDEGQTGLLFEPGNSIDLAQQVSNVWHDKSARIRMSREARYAYEDNFTAEPNYDRMIEIYEEAIVASGGQVQAQPAVCV